MIERRKKQRRKSRGKNCRRCFNTGLIQVGDSLEPIIGGEFGIQVEYCTCGAGLFNPYRDKTK